MHFWSTKNMSSAIDEFKEDDEEEGVQLSMRTTWTDHKVPLPPLD